MGLRPGVALRDASGKAYRVAGSLEEITRRKECEEELAHDRHLLHTLMDNLPDAIYFKDVASRFVRVNRAVAIRLGLDHPAQVVGKTHFDFFPEQDAQSNTADDQEMMRDKPAAGWGGRKDHLARRPGRLAIHHQDAFPRPGRDHHRHVRRLS